MDTHATHAKKLAVCLRRWAPGILSDREDEERQSVQCSIEGFLNRLDSMHRGEMARAKRRKSSEKMCAFFASMKMRDRSSFRDVLHYLLRATMRQRRSNPTQIKQDIANTIGADFGSLSRFQLHLDASLCRHMQTALSIAEGPLYLWADSSPKAGTD